MSAVSKEEVRFAWSARDADVLRSLKALLAVDGIREFTADDIFLLGLDRFFEDKTHEIGGWFASALHHGYIVRTGREKPSTRSSNKCRRIDVCTFPKEKAGEN